MLEKNTFLFFFRFYFTVCDSLYEEKGQENQTSVQKRHFQCTKNSDYEVTDVSNATSPWGWQEKAMFRKPDAAICLQGAAGDEMLLLMKWDCSVLSIYCS